MQGPLENLIYFRDPRFLTPRQARWQIFLSLFDYKLQYTKGSEMVQADALSRRPDLCDEEEPEPEILLPDWMFLDEMEVSMEDQELRQWIQEAGQKDQVLTAAVKTIKEGAVPPMRSSLSDWELVDEILLYKGKIYVPEDADLRREIV